MRKKINIGLIGRRNVGKSTLFNSIIGQKKAITADIPGVTRDFISFNLNGIIIYDTPGLDIALEDSYKKERLRLESEILRRTTEFLSSLDLILFIVSFPDIYPFDLDLSIILRKMNKPILVLINKIDKESDLDQINDYYQLGYPEILPISAKSKWNLDLLKEKIAFLLKKEFDFNWIFEEENNKKKGKAKFDQNSETVISIVGRPNSGKSTLLNKIIGKELALTSEVPGTTRDSIDTQVQYFGRNIIIADTAGIRKRGKRDYEVLERFSFERTEHTIRKSLAVILLLDAVDGITDTDKKILDIIIQKGRQVLIVINKWDLIESSNKDADKYWKDLVKSFPVIRDFSYLTVSALEGQRTHKIIKMVLEIIENSARYFTTSELNKAFLLILKNNRIVSTKGKFKIFYITQVAIHPPTFVLFVNNPKLIQKNAVIFIERLIKNNFGLKNNIIRLILRGKS